MSDTLLDPIAAPTTSAFGRILRLPFALRAPEPRFVAVEAVQRHWEAIRANRIAPARDEIDPRPLAANLDVLFIGEMVAPRVARLRLCGQHLGDLLGMDPRGMPLSAFFTFAARDAVGEALEQVTQGARVMLPLRAESGLGRPGLDGMLALMPLTDRAGKMSRVLGVLETVGQIGRAPRRFNLSAPHRAVTAVPVKGTPVLRVITGGRA